MSDEKPVVNYVSQPAPVVPVADTQSAAFQAAVAAAVKIALAQQAPAAPASGGELNQKLIEVLLKKEAREADAEQQKEIIKQTKQIQAGLNAQSTEQQKRDKQRRCKHIKGGKLQQRGIKDYNVHGHIFVDGDKVIKCDSCGMRWRHRDTKEWLYRSEEVRTANGIKVIPRKYRNHTGIGWHEAEMMEAESSSTMSKSEIVFVSNPQAQQAAAISETLRKQSATEVELYGTPMEDTEATEATEVNKAQQASVDDGYGTPIEESDQK